MRFYRFFSALAVLPLTASAALPAQATGSSSGEAAAHVADPQANNVPYTLTCTSTIVQTLANGATITRSFTVKSARDAEGRTYSEQLLTLPTGPDPRIDRVHYIVFDPVAHTNINWDNRTKIAFVAHIPASDEAALQPHAARKPKHLTREDLGVRTIAGVEARGTRTTLVVPAGDVGNDRPFTIVREEWISTQYGVPLLTVDDDPRSGKRTDEVTEFKPGEPDPALFRIPAGYAFANI